MRKLTSLQKGLIIYLIAITLLLVLAWGVNAIVAANPVRSSQVPVLDLLTIMPLPTVKSGK